MNGLSPREPPRLLPVRSVECRHRHILAADVPSATGHDRGTDWVTVTKRA